MSNTDSFIDEVSEEVRRDKLFAMFRKYGWIGVLIVLFVVGGAAYSEWRKAADETRAQVFGDAVLDALDLGGVEERREALGAIAVDGDQKAVLQLLLASDPDTDREATLAALEVLAADESQPQSYRDLATLRHVVVQGDAKPVSERRAALDPIAAPGRPFRTLALEQLAYLLVEENKSDEALAALQALMQDQEAPAGLRSRAEQMIVALGGEVQPSTAPQPVTGPEAGPESGQDDAG